jgi:hypothetical protein
MNAPFEIICFVLISQFELNGPVESIPYHLYIYMHNVYIQT